MRHTLDLSNVLAFAPRNTPLSVVAIIGSEMRKECERRGVHEGDRITCNESVRESLLVRSTSGRMLLTLVDALLIEVAPGLPS